jgi:serine/threonine-protein kinase RIO1
MLRGAEEGALLANFDGQGLITEVGERMLHHEWVAREWDTQCTLADAGADVPEPYAISPDALLMEYVHVDGEPAPLLCSVELDAGEAHDLFQAVAARTHPDSRKLLFRDVANVCRRFARFGVRNDAGGLAELQQANCASRAAVPLPG